MEGVAAGISVGCLIGIVTAMMTLLTLKDAFPPRSKEISFVERIFGRRQGSGIRLAAKLSTVPAFWFGGSWLSALVMNELSWRELRVPYLMTLAVVYTLIIAVPLSRLIARVCREIR